MILTTASETQAVGRQLGALLTGGEVIGLTGDLGSGKTCLIQGIAAGLGLDPATVTSPTFVFLHHHRGRLPFYHLDLYRLPDTPGGAAEVVGFFEMTTGEPDAVTAIEWAERAGSALPPEHLMVRLEYATPRVSPGGSPSASDEGRRLSLEAHGPHYLELLQQLQPTEMRR